MSEGKDWKGGLRIDSKLGEGGMGEIFLASHAVLKMPLVVKVLHEDRSTNIFQEAQLAARVSAPQVVPVWHAGEEDGQAYIIQRYVDGIDVEELLHFFRRMDRKLPLDTIWHILVEVALGLQEIHQAGVIHRDLKPANVFLAGNGSVCIGDFGLASVHSPLDDGEEGKGEGKAVAGTPQFMAPEQWEGRELDRRADLYSLGGLGHRLLTGEYPFVALNVYGLRVAHLDLPYEPPEPENPREAFLVAILRRLLEKDPAARYNDARSVARELEPLKGSNPRFELDGENRANVGRLKVRLSVGDLVEAKTDVLVSAANSALTMRLGVAEALRRAGGDEIESEAKAFATVPMGSVVWTGAGRLEARLMAHAVAAMDGAISLQRCTLRTLLEAETQEMKTIAFPALGAGVGRVPHELVAKMMLEAIRTFSSLEPQHLETVEIVLHRAEILDRWQYILEAMG